MSSVLSKGNRTTEKALRARLVSAGIVGWTLHSTDIQGKPDFVFPAQRIAVFVDGCFWHGCAKCRSIPESNRDFWVNRIGGNKRRDRRVNRALKKSGWTVLRFWEHDLRERPAYFIVKIKKALSELKHR
jgi:DNA mismatch endonuclease Vsr